ncbi:MAG: biopolymer transporter ExbD [Flavobacteriales bacterium]|nr:biopolymer transporter ExbD [Flavobacteriales bacterium]
MAQVPEGGGGGGGKGKKRAKKGSTHIDMTPMVDLAFLLLTFFILTTTMYKPSSLQMTYPVPPKPDDPPPPPTQLSNAVTLLLTKNDQIFYYKGEFRKEATEKGPPTTLTQTNFKDVQKLLVENNKQTVAKLNEVAKEFNEKKITEDEYNEKRKAIKGDKDNLKAIIKTDADAKYRNMIDMVDEMDISGIGSYGVVDKLKPEEQALLDVEKAKL